MFAFPLHPITSSSSFPFPSKTLFALQAALLSPDLHDPSSSPGHNNSCSLLEWAGGGGGGALFPTDHVFCGRRRRSISGILLSHCHLQTRLFLSRQNAPLLWSPYRGHLAPPLLRWHSFMYLSPSSPDPTQAPSSEAWLPVCPPLWASPWGLFLSMRLMHLEFLHWCFCLVQVPYIFLQDNRSSFFTHLLLHFFHQPPQFLSSCSSIHWPKHHL